MAGKHGGKREGAGRKWGAKTRPTIFDFWNDDDIHEFFEYLKDNYKEDMKLTQWAGDHIMGKAQQSIDHTTLGKELPTPILGAIKDDEAA